MRERDAVAVLAAALEVTVNDAALWRRALTHRSYAFEHPGTAHNERLEFLGDAVLGLVVTDRIYRREPHAPEGRLAKLRSVVVSEPSLAAVARDVGLGALVRLGVGEDASGGRDKDSILADTLEAVIGAAYLDLGLSEAERVVERLFVERIVDVAARPEAVDAKTALQELLAGAGRGLPTYEISETGPDHDKRFRATVHVEGEPMGVGTGRSKKEAEQGAAAEAVRQLRRPPVGGAVSSTAPAAAADGDAGDDGGRR